LALFLHPFAPLAQLSDRGSADGAAIYFRRAIRRQAVYRLVPLILPVLGFLLAEASLPAQTKTTGTIVGFVTAKGDAWIEIKADGEEKARRYLPIGGKGGPDPSVVKAIADTPIDARVQMDWRYDVRCRVVKLQVLKQPTKDPK
jgi:hypothetical protein